MPLIWCCDLAWLLPRRPPIGRFLSRWRLGGLPIVVELLVKLVQREFGSDLLAGISIVTSVLLGEYLAGTLVVLMLSGGEALESYAVRSAAVGAAMRWRRRMPSVAHRRQNSQSGRCRRWHDVAVGDDLVVFPHEICPVDGEVIEGHGVMDESYLTGEPYRDVEDAGLARCCPARSTARRR